MRCCPRSAATLLVLFAFVGCRTLTPTPLAALQRARSTGGYLRGTVVGLGQPLTLNREDFVYDARLSPDAQRLALSRLDLKSYFLSVHRLDAKPGQTRTADLEVCPNEFDLEALDFTPDGKRVVTASRDGVVRLFDVDAGKLEKAWLVEEPLGSLAVDPLGQWVAVGSSKGLVTVLSLPGLEHLAEARAHTDEVRGLVAGGGKLFAGSWDKSITAWSLTNAPATNGPVRARFEKHGELVTFRAAFDGKALGAVTLDRRVPAVVITNALATTLGLDVAALKDSITITTALGAQVAKVSRGHRLNVKGLQLEGLDVAVCDACVPKEVMAVLGAAFVERVQVAFDESTHEVLLASPDAGATSSSSLTLVSRFTFDGAINDLSLDAQGSALGVAFSATKGERTRDIYEREKKHEVEPDREWDSAAKVDTHTGAVLEKHHGHHGVVSSVAISPDGQTLVSAGWDRRVLLHSVKSPEVFTVGYPPRRVRFSRDGSKLSLASWTPINPLGNHQSDPAAVVFDVLMPDATVVEQR